MKNNFVVGKEYSINVINFEFDKTGKKIITDSYIFLGKVIQICTNHITFHKIDTVIPEGFKESFQKWDLNNYLVKELCEEQVQIA